MTDEERDKLYRDNGITLTHIDSTDIPRSKYDKTWIKYTFLDGDEITLQFGPICRMDQVWDYNTRTDELIMRKLKFIKLKKIRDSINDTTK